MKPRCGIVAVVLVLGIGCLLAHESCARNPLRRSDAEIRAWVLEKTPIGSTREQDMATIKREHWSGHEYYWGTGSPEWNYHHHFKYGADLGSYHSFFPPFFIFPYVLLHIGYSRQTTASHRFSSLVGAPAYEPS